jgi:RimJ/RimL family protein N-acetyltransferase
MTAMRADFSLQSARLELRPLTLDDADLMLAVWNDPAFYKYVGDRGIRTVEAAQEALAEGAFPLYEKYGYGPFRVALRANDEPIGTCGLFRREGYDDADIGWSVLPAYWGKGYAFEAARAVLAFAFDEVGLSRITAFISPDNVPSLGLARKLGLGYERMARLVGDDEDVCLYSMAHEREAI